MPKFHSLQVSDIRRETPDTVSVALDVPETLASEYQFIQGQYLTLKTDIDGEEVRRSYSICVSPLDQELRVAVKEVPGGKFSTFANRSLKVGETLDVMTPMGNFYTEIDGKAKKQYVAFAAGSGITPIMSIIRTVMQKEPLSSFTLFYGNKSIDTIIFREAIEAIKNEYLGRLSVHHILSREKIGSPILLGRINEEKCRTFAKVFFDPTTVDEYFLCGPEEMINTVTDTLKELNVAKEKLHFELFTSAGAKTGVAPPKLEISKEEAGKHSEVTVILDGAAFEFPLSFGGMNILDAALKQGADLPYACKGGVCCTCRAKLQEGEVEMTVNYALEPEEVAAGFILTCQAHPRSEKIVVDFDTK